MVIAELLVEGSRSPMLLRCLGKFSRLPECHSKKVSHCGFSMTVFPGLAVRDSIPMERDRLLDVYLLEC
ncbi:hypothetical protein SAMN02787118_11858 [Streptomyces mirabilis]|uniref:Uncharacterized protein n=1 Tax=Streptomyces mirabilis TaxID=68239 RepID=A0A1I2QJB5_9ACTN|nr:hypothetical protein SAMN02787118_11858 [Streptomyces mirabilis]